jgi:hypothetical protein
MIFKPGLNFSVFMSKTDAVNNSVYKSTGLRCAEFFGNVYGFIYGNFRGNIAATKQFVKNGRALSGGLKLTQNRSNASSDASLLMSI